MIELWCRERYCETWNSWLIMNIIRDIFEILCMNIATHSDYLRNL